MLEARDSADPEDRARWSGQIAERLIDLAEVQSADTLLVFWSFGSEVETQPAIELALASGRSIALPRIVDGQIEPRSWRPGEPLEPTSFGAMEPAAGRALDASEIRVVVTPGVAFDLDGYRVGYGGGFYDRLFTRLGNRAARVGIAFELQLVEGSLPRGGFDLPIDLLVTQDRTIRFAKPRRGLGPTSRPT